MPVAARLTLSRQSELWRGRSLFVIADEADERTWMAFLNAALRDSQPHVLLLVAEQGRDWGWLSGRSLLCVGVGAAGRGRLLNIRSKKLRGRAGGGVATG